MLLCVGREDGSDSLMQVAIAVALGIKIRYATISGNVKTWVSWLDCVSS